MRSWLWYKELSPMSLLTWQSPGLPPATWWCWSSSAAEQKCSCTFSWCQTHWCAGSTGHRWWGCRRSSVLGLRGRHTAVGRQEDRLVPPRINGHTGFLPSNPPQFRRPKNPYLWRLLPRASQWLWSICTRPRYSQVGSLYAGNKTWPTHRPSTSTCTRSHCARA